MCFCPRHGRWASSGFVRSASVMRRRGLPTSPIRVSSSTPAFLSSTSPPSKPCFLASSRATQLVPRVAGPLLDVTDGLIGTCGFSNWSLPHAHAELVYDLAPAFWGRGLMRAAAHQVLSWAFNTARFNRVHAFIMTSNAPSIRLIEALGFVREGTLQQYRIARGAARDFYVYALLQAAAGNAGGAPPNSPVQPTPPRAT
jgi:hypothetical protein